MAKRGNYNKMRTLEYIFDQKTDHGTRNIGADIDFTLKDVGEGIQATGGVAPASYSNFVLDLTRKKNTIGQRLPASVIRYGYDLRKKTGREPSTGDNYCGTFVYQGFDENGQTIPLQDWFDWGTPSRTITVENKVPELVQQLISNDEASLFSVMDYCNILSTVLGQEVLRVQSPMKWQPNEIDGYYVAKDTRNGNICVYPVEAKAISTADDINLVQINGQYHVFIDKYTKNGFSLVVRPIAARMERDGMLIAVLEHNPLYDPVRNRKARMFNVSDIVRVKLDPPLAAWRK